jgi:exosortase/archaeosortase family protein
MKRDTKNYLDIFIRYFLLVLIAIPGLDLFYYIFLPLTTHPIFWSLHFMYKPILVGNTIFIGQKAIEIAGACVAGSAYYFLLILNLSTKGINFMKRIYLVLVSFAIFFTINLVRIYLLSIMYLHSSPLFDITHKIFWYLGSTIFIVLIWFLGVYLFDIKGVPFYSDLKFMYSKTSSKKKK